MADNADNLEYSMNQSIVDIIVGPTCSGKSKLAMDIVEQKGGMIINADSLQVYKDISILTAQPTHADMEKIPHVLYGFLEFNEKINAVSWAKLAAKLINKRKVPVIVVGGTGMYIDILINGYSDMPLILEENRKKALEIDYKELCSVVYNNDNSLQEIIKPSQKRQMLRAYETLLQTGISIRHFFEKPKIKLLSSDIKFNTHIIIPERKLLYDNINIRFRSMIDNGAIEEVEQLLEKTNNKRDYQIFQAIGAIQIANYLEGNYKKEEMIEIACRNSRRYAKRQITWFKNQKIIRN